MNDNIILDSLNDSQREAVLYCDGPSLVIAGAGSGKTRVLTYKIAYLLQNGMKPWNILALTFTNKAAREMKSRIGKLVGEHLAAQLNMGTFHSVFSRILRVEAFHLGYNSNFTIYDDSDSRSLVKAIVKEMQLDDKVYKPATISGRISMAKNHLILAGDYPNHKELVDRDKTTRTPEMAKIYMTYCERCRKANAMDFDDLLVNTWLLFLNHSDVLSKYVNKFNFVLVDEYQDTNFVQQSIVLQLTKERQQVCVVGDDAQSIYSFRGANIDNILNFNGMYKNPKLFKLEQNYRSTQLIVQAANSLIKHNTRQIPKDVFSENNEGEKLILKPAYSDKEEALIVCNDIQRLHRIEKLEYNDFAILYRTNSQSRSFEEAMRKMNIPYRIYGGLSFYQRKEIKDIIAYFRLVANPDDEEAFRRIINYPTRGIGNTTVLKIIESAAHNAVSLWQVISNSVMFALGVNKGTATKISGFKDLIQSFIDDASNKDAYTLGTEIIKLSGISNDIYSNSDQEGLSRQQNLQEFLSGMQDFVESRREEGQGDNVLLSDFLQEVSLLTDLDSDKDVDAKRVTLMTIHSAKGLEFPTVFVVGLEENIFPSPMSSNSARELEEERRLLYVAITRAEKHCILTCAQNRFRYGTMEYDTPSRFIRDIDPNYLKIDSEISFGKYSDMPSYGGMGGSFGSDRSYGNPKNQNPHPVAHQFIADDKIKITNIPKRENPKEIFSDSFKEKLRNAGYKPVNRNSANRESVLAAKASSSLDFENNPSRLGNELVEGNLIEHQRFGVGKVLKIEGVGENAKATVEFKNSGTKQLLLKFAKFNILE